MIPTQSRESEINETLDALGITNPVVRGLVFRVTGELSTRCVPVCSIPILYTMELDSTELGGHPLAG